MDTTSLKQRLNETNALLRLAGAHDALSAKMVESAGFDGVWASSLEISASAGVADDEQVTTKCVLPKVKEISGVVKCPIVVDCASGPQPTAMKAFVGEAENVGANGLCFEDAGVPKINSLRNGQQPLANCSEFCDKISAAAEACQVQDTCIIARVESLIAGAGQEDALQRANAYVAAGADAVLIHSKSSTPTEVLSFVEAWDRDVPLVIVPSTYVGLTIDDVRDTGKVKVVIYANQGLRAAMAAMQHAFKRILNEETTRDLEDTLAPLADVFAIQDACVKLRSNSTNTVLSDVS